MHRAGRPDDDRIISSKINIRTLPPKVITFIGSYLKENREKRGMQNKIHHCAAENCSSKMH